MVRDVLSATDVAEFTLSVINATRKTGLWENSSQGCLQGPISYNYSV